MREGKIASLFYDNELWPIENIELTRIKWNKENKTRENIKEYVTSTRNLLAIIESGEEIPNLKDTEQKLEIYNSLIDGLWIVEELYPNILVETENEMLVTIATDALINF